MKLLEVRIVTKNLEETENFYSNRFGLPVSEKSKNSVSFVAGASKLTFEKSAIESPVYHFAFNICHNHLRESLVWARQRFEIIPATPGKIIADFDNWNAQAFYFYDNNGNILEFIARYDLNNALVRPFEVNSIQSISEIAFVTNDVFSFCDRLSIDYSITKYEKQPMLANFAAYGDAEGLFIVSKEGRHWYPTDKVAERFPLYVRMMVGEKIRELSY
jgi:catechol 2,3-dioxygenase-like lactoylglutathione lyase family enzyme